MIYSFLGGVVVFIEFGAVSLQPIRHLYCGDEPLHKKGFQASHLCCDLVLIEKEADGFKRTC
jgi:hypothetical protein